MPGGAQVKRASRCLLRWSLLRRLAPALAADIKNVDLGKKPKSGSPRITPFRSRVQHLAAGRLGL